jgi:SAM-dependent methyltransferase
MTIGGRLGALIGRAVGPAEEQDATEPERRESVLPVTRTLCWATHEEAERLGVAGQGTRYWAYRWIEEHVRHMAPIGVAADLGGGGVDSVLCSRLSPHARRVLVIDKMGQSRRRGNIEEASIDLEQGLRGLGDASIDLFVTASSIEHLTAEGQRRLFTEIERTLKPDGVFCGTISYITRLDAGVLELLQSDPVFEQVGSSVLAPFDLRACLSAAPRLRPPYAPSDWSRFPGYAGFDESWLLNNDVLVAGQVGSYGTVRCLPEVDALALKWFELGLFLRKAS